MTSSTPLNWFSHGKASAVPPRGMMEFLLPLLFSLALAGCGTAIPTDSDPAASPVVNQERGAPGSPAAATPPAQPTPLPLFASAAGRVEQLGPGLRPGARFRAGELLALIVGPEAAREEQRALAALRRAEVEEARLRLTVQQRLLQRARGAEADASLDAKLAAVRAAAAKRREAERAVERARRSPERIRIEAPFDGSTRTVGVEPGRFVESGVAIARIAPATAGEGDRIESRGD